MPKFIESSAKKIAEGIVQNEDEKKLVASFVEICRFLSEFPDEMSWRISKSKPNKPTVLNDIGLELLANRYFKGYRRSDFPADPSTVPDEMVSIIMKEAYGYSEKECDNIKKEHQYSMCAENSVGNLLERYLDAVLREKNWFWCCGEFVKAIDFLSKNKEGDWIALQIKNRDNSENSSSSAIRDGTKIQKWYRTLSKDTKKGRASFTRWDKLPSLMSGYGLREENFKKFVIEYIKKNRPS